MVLILEDQEETRKNQEFFLEKNNIPFISFTSDREIYFDQLMDVDTAIIDLQGCEGKEVIIELKKCFPNVFIIVTTCYLAPDILPKNYVNLFVRKPFNFLESILPILERRYSLK